MGMTIKAVSLYEPWASLIRCGAKTYETRSQPTHYRGPLLICASKGGLSRRDLRDMLDEPDVTKALGHSDPRKLLFGKAVASCVLIGCHRTENLFLVGLGKEGSFGDFSPRRYAWKLGSVKAIEPFPVTGKQGLFEVDIPEEGLNDTRKTLV